MFGIGIPELIFILLLALIILGPKEMQEVARDLGRWMNRFVKSEAWRTMRTIGHEVSTLPTRLMREAEREIWENDPSLREQTIRPAGPVSYADLKSVARPSNPTSASEPLSSEDKESSK